MPNIQELLQISSFAPDESQIGREEKLLLMKFPGLGDIGFIKIVDGNPAPPGIREIV